MLEVWRWLGIDRKCVIFVGNDVIGQISILSTGTGQNINAGFTLTFHDGSWTTAPVCLAVRGRRLCPAGHHDG
jgi:hypothetical protein